jgi:hypothetical protein
MRCIDHLGERLKNLKDYSHSLYKENKRLLEIINEHHQSTNGVQALKTEFE